MAGKPKNTVSYFPHYVNDSRTLFILTEKWGDRGYCFWYRLLELLCKTDGHFYTCKDELDILRLVKATCINKFSTDDNIVFTNDVLNLLVERNKLDRELWDNDKIIWCQNLVDNLESVYRNRRRSIPEKPKLHVGNAKPTKQRKVKERKVNKSKYMDDSIEMAMTNYAIEQIQKNHPEQKFSAADKQGHCSVFDKLVRLDGKTIDQIRDVLMWIPGALRRNDFCWSDQFLSPASLRNKKKGDDRTKFDKMYASMISERSNGKQKNGREIGTHEEHGSTTGFVDL